MHGYRGCSSGLKYIFLVQNLALLQKKLGKAIFNGKIHLLQQKCQICFLGQCN